MSPAAFLDDLKLWEGVFSWMYLDVLGYVTTGIGHLLKTPEDAQALPWRRIDSPIGQEEVARIWTAVKASPAAKAASWYLPLNQAIRLAPGEPERLAIARLEREFLPELERLFAGFGDYPELAKRCLVDVAWNVGTHGIEQFHHLREACAGRQWSEAAKHCHVKTSREKRNEWRAQLLRAAAGVEAVS